MNIVLNKIRIKASVERVFDSVTTARYWPLWHPSCISVEGATDQPYQLGDEISQIAHVANRTRQGTWLVTEHEVLKQVMLEMYGGLLQVRYSFITVGSSTRLIRRLTYPTFSGTESFSAVTLERIMHDESELGLRQLKSLIERQEI